ncbi:MAG: pantoate--beta-alanine ligase [Nitrospirae bacterium]|nr:pantoate--beta-alanine ligase [Nitrospirota bacterium]
MQTIRAIKEMQALSTRLRSEGKSIGFVPTMGALHEGHLSLLRRSKDENVFTAVSIFVNPTQFGPQEDFNKYPRDLDGDLDKLSPLKVDAVFFPDAGEMYPEGFSTSIQIGHIGEILCGASRPGHFNGVATVVSKLFNIVMPHRAYFGQKDFQQTAVIRKLVRELNFDIDVNVCPTVRETDGLAMSSRNAYLTKEQRKAAAILFRSLMLGKDLVVSGRISDARRVKSGMMGLIEGEPLVGVEYVEVVDAENLAEIREIKTPAAICLAVRIGDTRLIDNIIIDNMEKLV